MLNNTYFAQIWQHWTSTIATDLSLCRIYAVMLYREHLDEICAELSLYAAFLKQVDALRPDWPRPYDSRSVGSRQSRRPYQSLERMVERLEAVRPFYPSRAEIRQGAYDFTYDPSTGTYEWSSYD